MDIDRRSFFFASASVIGALVPAAGGKAADHQCAAVRGRDCTKQFGKTLCLTNADAMKSAKASSGPPPTIQVPWEEKKALRSSNSIDFDNALKRVVFPPLYAFFKINPTFWYYDDERYDGRANALASTDGTIYFGTKLLANLLARKDGDFAVMAACAHEWGHLAQFNSGTNAKLMAKNLPCYCIELHADLLAGFFTRRFKQIFQGANFQGIVQAWEAWDVKSCTHGSRAQRLEALEAGYEYGDPDKERSLSDAIEEGADYLTKYA